MSHPLIYLNAGEHRLTKRHSRKPGGLLTTEGYEKAFLHRVGQVDVAAADRSVIEQVAEVVTILAPHSNMAIIRGGLTLFGTEEVTAGRTVRRTARNRPNAPAVFRDVPQPWGMLDIDCWATPLYEIIDDPASVIEAMVAQLLPLAFHELTMFWQLSSSCGFVRDVCKAHLWFALTQPRLCSDLRYHLETEAPDVDPAIAHPIQLHYTADPVLNGVTDPLPVRLGWRYGEIDAIDIPAMPPKKFRPPAPRPPGEGVRPEGALMGTLAAMGDGPGLVGFHAPLRRAAVLYAKDCVVYGRPRDDADQIALMQSCVECAPCRDNRRERYTSESYLLDLIRSAFDLLERDPATFGSYQA